MKKVNPLSANTKTDPVNLNNSSKTKKVIIISLGVVLGFLLLILISIGIPAYMISSPIKQTGSSLRTVMSHFQNQDLVSAEAELANTKVYLLETKNKYKLFSWSNLIPFVRNYYQDGKNTLEAAESGLLAAESLIKAIEPYSDILGFKAKEGTSALAVESAEERIIFLAQTLDAISPKLDDVSQNLRVANEKVSSIDPKRYPESLAGTQIRSNIIKVQEGLEAATVALTDAKPLIKILPDLLGQEEEQLYMLVFQNDGELRPTGGFLTAYAYLRVNKGKIEPLDSYDIYDLDSRFTKNVEAPEAIKKYLDENRWFLRNMNFSPDFKYSMETFIENYNTIPSVRKINGVIAIDTNIPVKLLEVLGPIGVGGWGTFSAENDPRCDCPQVVYALENITTKPTTYIREDRKAVLGPLMHSLAANAMGSPKSMWPQLLNIVLDSIKEKHLMFYFPESEEKQSSAEAFSAAGRIKDYDGDYLHVSDSNLGGAKSNLFVTQDIEEEISSSNGSTSKILTITYNNPHPPSNCNLEAGQLCLNGVLRDYVRVYVPLGSKLTRVVGSEVQEIVSEDLGKTVFEVFFTLRPQSSSKLVFEYELPQGLNQKSYRYLIQKQAGKPNQKHKIIFNGEPIDLVIKGDQELVLP